jgi:predicted NBD/HSP70 family sugar kinase
MLAEKLGLSLLKTSSVLSGLEKKNLIRKAGKLQVKTGRPSIIYDLCPEQFYAMGVSVESSLIRIIIIDADKSIVYKNVIPLSDTNNKEEYIDNLIEQLDSTLSSVLSEFREQGKHIVSTTLALTGMIDSKAGIWLLGLQVGGVSNIPLASILKERLDLPVFIEDKSRSITFMENTIGNGADVENFVLLYIGRGVGAGIVIEDEIYRGVHGVSGEIGHITHGQNNYRCSCGNVGCIETIVSTGGIVRTIKERLHEGVVSSLQDSLSRGNDDLSPETILQAAENGDRLAQSTLFEIGQFIGDACVILIKLFNPNRLIISGYGSIFKDYFREPINLTISQRIVPEMTKDYSIVYADYELHHEAYGAALLAMKNYFEHAEAQQ